MSSIWLDMWHTEGARIAKLAGNVSFGIGIYRRFASKCVIRRGMNRKFGLICVIWKMYVSSMCTEGACIASLTRCVPFLRDLRRRFDSKSVIRREHESLVWFEMCNLEETCVVDLTRNV